MRESLSSSALDYVNLVTLRGSIGDRQVHVAGTLFGSSAPRLVDIFGVAVEAELNGNMLYIVNSDAPGFIDKLWTTLGSAGLKIATFNLGRRAAGGEAVALVAIDDPVPAQVVEQLCALEGVREVVPLRF